MQRIALLSIHTCPMITPGERDAGGMNVYLGHLAKELTRQRLKVDIFTRLHDPTEPTTVDLGNGIRIIHIEAGPPGACKEELYPHLRTFLYNIHRFVLEESLSYDIIHAHYWLSGFVGMSLSRAWKVPHLASFHTLAEVKRRSRSGTRESKLRTEVERRIAASADAVVVSDRHERDALALLYGANPNKVHVITPGVDTKQFHPMDRQMAKHKLGLDGKRVLLFVGRLDPLKGIELLLQSVRVLENHSLVTLLIVGGGSHEADEIKRLRLLAQELGIAKSVRFEGVVPHDALPLYYNATDALVMPSYYESFGLAALEAMACSTPVVAARVGGLASLVRDGETGYLVPWHCPEPFASRLEVLLTHQHLRESMGKAARHRAINMDWGTMSKHMTTLYQGLQETRYAFAGG